MKCLGYAVSEEWLLEYAKSHDVGQAVSILNQVCFATDRILRRANIRGLSVLGTRVTKEEIPLFAILPDNTKNQLTQAHIGRLKPAMS